MTTNEQQIENLNAAIIMLYRKESEVARFQTDGLTDKALDVLESAVNYLEVQLGELSIDCWIAE